MMDLNVESLARGYTTKIITTLGGWATEPDAKIDEDIKIRAMGMLLDRGWGKPRQPQEMKVEGQLELILRDVMAEKAKKK